MNFGSFHDFLGAQPGCEIDLDANLADAHDTMQSRRVSTLVVVGQGAMCGVISEMDILRHVSQHGGFHSEPVRYVMRRVADEGRAPVRSTA